MKKLILSYSFIVFALAGGCVSTAPKMTEQGNFNEGLYQLANPDVAELIQQGKYRSGLDHYTQIGQTATKPDGEHYGSFFTGTKGNDIVQGIGRGEHAHFAGVDFEIIENSQEPFPVRPKSFGTGEKDILIGTKEGGNEFILGSFITSVNPASRSFYVGQGDEDFATIRNFTKSRDVLLLAGKPDRYRWQAVGGNVRIYTADGDLIAIVEGIDRLEVGEIVKDFGVFTWK